MRMAETPAKVIDSGRVTIPVTIRERLNLSKGDYVIIEVRPVAEGNDERPG